MPKSITVRGGYGRDYKSGKAMKADWEAGLDFHILTPGYPTYMSKRDVQPGETIGGRFRNLTGYVTLHQG
jgi:hypothetical protein